MYVQLTENKRSRDNAGDMLLTFTGEGGRIDIKGLVLFFLPDTMAWAIALFVFVESGRMRQGRFLWDKVVGDRLLFA